MSKQTYYLTNKTKDRVIIETEYDFMTLSGAMSVLDKDSLDKIPMKCKPYNSFLKVKLISWLYDLEVVKQSELVDIICSFQKKHF